MKLHNNILSNSSYSPMRRIASALSRIALAAFLAVGAASCEDDFEPPYIDNLSVGKEVAVTIPISLPGMDVQSRSSVDETYLNAVHSLWIGIFDAQGNMTSRTRENKETIGWYKVENPSNSDIHELHNVTVYAATGPSHIVAIANVGAAKGVMSDDSDMTLTDLTTLLNNVVEAENPWAAFNKIGVQSYTDPRSLIVPDNYQDYGLVMSGRYYNAPAAHPADWAATNQETTFIKTDQDGSFTLPGAIHLRRLQSHITFNVKPGDPDPTSTEKIVSVKVTSYQVCNTPRYAFAYEQTGNFGDVDTKDIIDTYIEEAVTVPGTSIKYDTDNDGYITNQTFDFWQTENKHTAINTISDYNEREKRSESDHSIFTSLTGGDKWSNNNLASYVVLTCNVTYLDKINVDDEGNTVSENNGEEVYRTGVVRYTIHHGYINNDANDFNCYRNCDYTYNVEITGLESVRVEAITTDHSKDVNGAEGIVTDLTTATIQLDSHFAQFNIALSYDELFKQDGSPNPDFGFLINSPYNNTVYSTFDNSGDLDRMATETTEREKHKFYNWIEIKSTDNATTYAKYIPARGGSFSNEDTQDDATNRVIPFWQFVKELRDGTLSNNHPSLVPSESGTKYYTIFINEYTYEPRYGEVDNANWGDERFETTRKNEWQDYVNQDPRQFYILTQRSTSADGQSVYARSKYAVSQRSIQSYYTNVEGLTSETALGIEHINETQGLNMRNHFIQTHTNFSFSRNNGRYNIAVWLSNSNTADITLNNVNWNDFIAQDALQKIKTPSDGKNPQKGPAILSVTAGYNPAGKSDVFGFTHLPSTIQLTTDYTLGEKQLSEYDPQKSSTSHEDYIEAINACMNRNRDENGNGTIENEELKWYIPASGKYLRAILGRHSLETPIMPYEQVTELPSGYNEVNSRYHIYASNGMVVWAMEGLSANPWNYGWTTDNFKDPYNGHVPAQPAWQVRCIRNLGTNLKTIQNTDNAAYENKVQRAYVYDSKNKIVRMTYYDSNSKRIKRIDGRGNAANSEMPIHSVTSDNNMVYNAFEISNTEHITASINGMTALRGYIEGTRTGNATNNYCATYSQNDNDTRGWRLPNQKEIAIMVNLHAIYTETGDSNYKIFSTTDDGKKFSLSTTLTTEYALTCTYTYFENTSPYTGGTTYNRTSNNHNFIGSLTYQGTQMSPTNMSGGKRFYIRCVRDVD